MAIIGKQSSCHGRHGGRDHKCEQLIGSDIDAERLSDGLVRANGAPGTPGPAAQEIDANQQREPLRP